MNTVKIDYFAVTVKNMAPERVLTDILLVPLEDFTCMPAFLNIIKSGEISECEVTIYEGKFHQVKRMFQACGKEVVYLKRISMGELKLDESLKLGHYRPLTDEEINSIL